MEEKLKENMKNDNWSKYFDAGTEESDLYEFTSITGWLPFSKDGFEVVTQWIGENDLKILEAGSGSGRSCIELATRNTKREITGTDLSEKMLEVSKKGAELRKLRNVTFIKADIFKLPFQNNTYDVVFNKGVIEHFDNYEEVVKEMVRVTKKGGKVIIAVPNKYNFFHPLVYLYKKYVIKTYPYGKEILFTPKRLKDLCNKIGLINIAEDGYGVFYRLSKFIDSKNLLARIIQNILKLLAVILNYIIAWPLDKISCHRFSRLFGWEIMIKGVKS